MRTMLIAPVTLALVAPALAQLPGLKPGRWQNTTIIAGEKPMVATECQDAETLSDPDRLGLSKDPRCVWKRKVIGGGVIDVAGDCPSGARSGQRFTSSIKGSYSPTSTAMTITTMLAGKPVTMRINGNWIGQCSPED